MARSAVYTALIWLGIYLMVATLTAQDATPKSTLIGYDCSDHKSEYTVVSLTDITACKSDARVAKTERTKLQVLQTKLYRPIHIHGCKLRILRFAFYCGWQSYISPKPDMIYSGIKKLGKLECENIHIKKVFSFAGGVFRDIRGNSTTSSTINLAGSIDDKSNCKPVVKYSDEGGVLENVVVTGQFELTIFDAYAVAVMAEDTLIVSTLGISCPLKTSYCSDSQQGEIYWVYSDETDCRGTSIDILYEGPGEVITLDRGDRVLSVATHTRTFALRLEERAFLCHQDVWKTEHGRIYVAGEGSLGYRFPSSQGPVYAPNVDMTSYIDSKFLFTSLAVWNSTQSMMDAMRYRECETRRMVLQNRLIIARQSPDMISLVTQGAGVYGRLLGEVLYIIKCIPVGVGFRSPEQCYQEIPVEYKGRPMFLSPVTRLLLPEGSEVPCKSLLQPRFMIGQKWYVRGPELIEVTPPSMLDPNEDMDWNYEPFLHISAGGLYSQEQLRSLQQEMMFPASRDAFATKVFRRMMNSNGGDLDMSSMLTASDISSITDVVAGKISWFFKLFGHYASVIIGVYVVGKFVIYILGVLTNCFIIKKSGRGGKAYIASLVDAFTSLITLHSPSRFQKLKIRQVERQAGDSSEVEPSCPPLNNVTADTATGKVLYQQLRKQAGMQFGPTSQIM